MCNSWLADELCSKVEVMPIKVDDMIMSQSQYYTPVNPGQNSGQKDLTFRWPNGVVPYKIENQFNDQDKASINEAITSLNQELNGCINIR